MGDKRRVRTNMRRLQRVRTWQLVIILIIVGFISATFLRLNNIGMIERRSAVMAADESGDTKALQDRLYDLQRYVSAHMNTSMGKGVYLISSYKRDSQTAYDNALNESNINGNIYKKVQDVCRPRFSRWSGAYVQCVRDELAKYPDSKNLTSSVNWPRADMYLHVFISPLWSSDFAGWSVIVFIVILVLIIIRLASRLLLRLLLRHHYKSI